MTNCARDAKAWADAQRLLAWDARFHPDSEPAALFVLLRQALFEGLLGDELGPELEHYTGVALDAYNGVQEVVRTGRSRFWDDTSTAQTETPADIWARALRTARARLDQGAGATGTLGTLRKLTFAHAFSRIPLLGSLFDVGPLPSGGDDYTVNVRKTEPESPRLVSIIPGYRELFTPGDWTRSRSVQALGQGSGHRFSAYRSDQFADWQTGRMHRLPWNGPGPGVSVGRLRLTPAQ